MKKIILLFVILSIIFSVFGAAISATNEKDQYVGDILHLINDIEKDYYQEHDEENAEEYNAILKEDMDKLRELVYKYGWFLVDSGEYNSEVLNIVYYIQLAINGVEPEKNFNIARAILDENSSYVAFKNNHS